MDLRSSTEELQYMEPEKGKTEKEKPQVQLYSPVMFKLEEQQTISLHHKRKDSSSSEVAAFLSISGRTSRISSVGSQGSANSKLSAVSDMSGMSRSPSPHRMLLETSFCGPKPLQDVTDGNFPSSIEPLTAKVLEQVILSRRKDPTEVVMAEGISVYTSFAVSGVTHSNKYHETEITRRKSDSNANINHNEAIQPPQTSRSISNKRYIPPTDLNKPIVGVMPSGTEYIRIKLKPDHCYSDNGIADNERILQNDHKKPQSLNLNSCRIKNVGSNNSLKPASRFKPSRENDNQSSYFANTTFSRKSSFCSIFKLKDSDNSDTPSGSNLPKCSGLLSHELIERSHDLNTLPSKPNSGLAIFKSKKNNARSKSPSPIDTKPQDTLLNMANVDLKNKNESLSATNPPMHLRYYDIPLDGQSIHIPLHTPPEEKQLKTLLSTYPMQPSDQKSQTTPDTSSHSRQFMKLSNNCYVATHNRPQPMPPLKCYRIENPDGTVTIPLKSPTEEMEHDSLWSMEVQHDNSLDSHETVISVAAHHISNTLSITCAANALPLNSQSNLHDVFPYLIENSTIDSKVVAAVNNDTDVFKSDPTVFNISSEEQNKILFSVKMGSNSEEQTFTTQFCISKTESQSSHLSEAAQDVSLNEYKKDFSDNSPVVYRNKTINSVKTRSPKERYIRSESTSGDSSDSHRHSRCIETPEENVNALRKCDIKTLKSEFIASMSEESSISQDTSKEECTVKMLTKCRNVLNTTDIKLSGTNDEQSVSYENEKDSEVDTSKHLHPNMLTIEDHESAGLVLQESFDDELPYIPTTLPEERAVGVKIVPMKDRAQIEMKTYPLERPRSTTPIYPAAFEKFCGITQTTDEPDGNLLRGEKLRISLPKKHDIDKVPKFRSPQKIPNLSDKNCLEYVEHKQMSNNGGNITFNSQSFHVEKEPPPLPPRKGITPQWIDFDSIPEKRKHPYRTTTIPQESSDGNIQLSGVVYTYVQPEECQCECHENERESGKQQPNEIGDEKPLLQLSKDAIRR